MAEVHLRDLFRSGQEIKISVPMPDGTVGSVSIWMRIPTAELQQDAMRKAGGKAARVKARYRDKSGEEYLALRSQVDDLESRAEIEEFLVSTEDSEIREEAYNDILYGTDWGSNWGAEPVEEGPKSDQEPLDYINILQALTQRRQEIEEANAFLPPGERVGLEADEEHSRLQELWDKFQKEVEDRAAAIREDKTLALRNRSDEELRDEVMKSLVDIEQRTAWLTEYNNWMMHYSCRDMRDKKRYYFRDPSEIEQMPNLVRSQLNEHYREVNRAGSDLKVSASPEDSLVSLEPSEELVAASNPSSPTG